MKQWEKWQEEAAKRDHRKVGKVSCDRVHSNMVLIRQMKVDKPSFVNNT